MCVCVCVCVCVLACVREEDKVTQPRLVCKHIWASLLSVTWLCSPFGLELMVKLRTLLTVFTLVLKAEAHGYGKGSYISNAACGVRTIAMPWVSWPIRADCDCRKEGLCRKLSVWERRGIEFPTIMNIIFKKNCFLTHYQISLLPIPITDPSKLTPTLVRHDMLSAQSNSMHHWTLTQCIIKQHI